MIKVAVVGTGGISHAHIGAYLKFPDRCKIVALVDIIPGKAERVKEQYHLDAAVYLDHHEILDELARFKTHRRISVTFNGRIRIPRHNGIDASSIANTHNL